jgi:hypothetical protein
MNKIPVFVKDAGERLAKTFVQFYLGFWLLTIGLLDTVAVQPGTADAFSTLFTVDNLKAGVVGVALSLATSFASKPFGNKEDASLVRT